MVLLNTIHKGKFLSLIHSLWQRGPQAGALLLLISLTLGGRNAEAQRFTSSILNVNATTTAATTSTLYFGLRGQDSTTAVFAGADLGKGNKFDLTSGNLNITAFSDTLFSGGAPFNASSFHYRVYLVGASTIPSYTNISMTRTSASTTSTPVTYANNGTTIDLLATPKTIGGGTYQVDIYYDATYRLSSKNTLVTDPGNGATNPYSATFTVIAPDVTPSGSSTTWQSTSSTSWFLASNWSNGVPDASSNAIIPENKQGTNIVFPILNNLARHYVVNNLTLQGNTSSGKAQLTIQNAVLRVYGNISQITGGLVGAFTNSIGVEDSVNNSTLVLAGANQFVTGRLSVPDIIIAGSGIKSVANTMLPTNTLSFRPTDTTAGVIVQSAGAKTNNDGTTSYVFDTTGNSLINLGSNGQINTNAGSNETNSSYVKGILTAAAQFVAGTTNFFGNIGLDILPNHSALNITVTRTIGDPLLGPTTPAPGSTPVPIKRQYQIVGDDNTSTAATSGSLNTIVFHYLPSTYELNGITESNLAMFRTTTGSAPYSPIAGTLDMNAHTVTRADLPTFANFYLTLGDKTNPLPVSLTAFTATRSNLNTALAWTTASELNNTGFEVQVSADGATFRKLAFVATQNSNSTQQLNYTYTDTEAGKTGIRYYRLRQIDISGEEAFSPVRAVSFDGATSTSNALAAYPNPFTDKLDFNLDATTVGNGVAHVQLLDMTGRTVREQNLAVANASLSLSDLSNLRSGLYLAKVTLPDGSIQTVRIQKQ